MKSKLIALFLGLSLSAQLFATGVEGPVNGSSTPNVANATGTLPVANGGTNVTSATDDSVLLGNGTTFQLKAIADCIDSGGNHLNYTASTNTLSCGTSGSGGSVAGSNTQVQFNDSSAFGGDADFVWDKTANTLTIGSAATPGLLKSPQGATSSAGVLLTIQAGNGGATSGTGGAVIVSGGTATDGVGGQANLNGGNGAGTNRAGGEARVVGGNGIGSADGAVARLTGGNGGATGNGGGISILGGPGGATSGNGGAVTLTGGLPTTSGNGGAVSINGRNGAGTAKNGGFIDLAPGNASDSGGFVGTINMTKWQADTSYNYLQPTTGFSQTITDGVGVQILDPAGTLATGTVTMPAKPNDGQIVRVSSTQIITTLTVSPNSGQSIKNAPTTLAAGGSFAYIYRATGTTWFVYR